MDASRADDSDSDLEDFHHVVEESRHQIKVAESVLKRHHKDVMDTGIYMDPSKYVSRTLYVLFVGSKVFVKHVDEIEVKFLSHTRMPQI